jgi:hypothetical protein
LYEKDPTRGELRRRDGEQLERIGDVLEHVHERDRIEAPRHVVKRPDIERLYTLDALDDRTRGIGELGTGERPARHRPRKRLEKGAVAASDIQQSARGG